MSAEEGSLDRKVDDPWLSQLNISLYNHGTTSAAGRRRFSGFAQSKCTLRLGRCVRQRTAMWSPLTYVEQAFRSYLEYGAQNFVEVQRKYLR
jgi:hypothetical protein